MQTFVLEALDTKSLRPRPREEHSGGEKIILTDIIAKDTFMVNLILLVVMDLIIFL